VAITHRSEVVLEVDGDDPAAIQKDLNAAVLIAQRIAMCYGRDGVLITQHDYWSFSVTTSPDIPYGEIRQNTQWRDLEVVNQNAGRIDLLAWY
jgi:hypothetical protein